MNKTQEALKMAVEALEDLDKGNPICTSDLLQACKEALAELEQTKQLGVVYNGNAYWVGEAPDNGTPLYTTPPKRECGEAEQSAEIAHYKAQINELREALEMAKLELEIQGCADLEKNDVGYLNYKTVINALTKTAPQCLQEQEAKEKWEASLIAECTDPNH